MTKSSAVFKDAVSTAFICAAFGGSVALAAWYCGSFDDFQIDKLDAVVRAFGSTLAQIALTLAGFILTSTAIFTAFGDKPLIQNMYRSGHAKNLIVHMYIAIFFDLLACVFGLWVSIAPKPTLIMMYALIGLATACLVTLLGVMRKLWYVLTFIHGDKLERPDVEFEDVDHTPTAV